MTKVSTLINQIDNGTLLLPEFQRCFVWNRGQIRQLMRSLYLEYPIGGLLTWETSALRSQIATAECEEYRQSPRVLLLDGQQRMSTLYAIIRGKPPTFFDGDPRVFDGLSFHLREMNFEFASRTRHDPLWIDVRQLLSQGIGAYLESLSSLGDVADMYVNRLNQLIQIQHRDIPEERISGFEGKLDTVVDIFNQVNAAGRKLSKGDIALAKLCAQTQNGRQMLRRELDRWTNEGFNFSLDLFLRTITAVSTGRAAFSALETLTPLEFKQASTATSAYVDTFLNVAAKRLGLDHGSVLLGTSAIPVVGRLLHLAGGDLADYGGWDRALYWYVQAALCERYRTSTEATLNRDLAIADTEGVDGLIAELERSTGGRLSLLAEDFGPMTRRARALVHMVTWAQGGRDLLSGKQLELTRPDSSSVEWHSIFPKAALRDAGLPARYVNAVANMCPTNTGDRRAFAYRDPDEYLCEIEEKFPGILSSQSIPMDRDLWRIARYPDFVDARSELLAQAGREILSYLSRPLPSGTEREDATIDFAETSNGHMDSISISATTSVSASG